MSLFIDMQPIGKLFYNRILLDSYSPIFFTCIDKQNNHYLVAFYYDEHDIKKWLLTQVNPLLMIDLLKDQISIRNAFVEANIDKYELVYHKGHYRLIKQPISHWKDLNNVSLPRTDAFLEVEKGEFDDDIAYFEMCFKHDFSKTTKESQHMTLKTK